MLTVTCPDCDGTGNCAPSNPLPWRERYIECGLCDGTGRIPMDCETCHNAQATVSDGACGFCASCWAEGEVP